jgi:hypothetical protein
MKLRGSNMLPCDTNHPNIEGCDYCPLEVSAVGPNRASIEAAAQTRLTPEQIRSRIRTLVDESTSRIQAEDMH